MRLQRSGLARVVICSLSSLFQMSSITTSKYNVASGGISPATAAAMRTERRTGCGATSAKNTELCSACGTTGWGREGPCSLQPIPQLLPGVLDGALTCAGLRPSPACGVCGRDCWDLGAPEHPIRFSLQRNQM